MVARDVPRGGEDVAGARRAGSVTVVPVGPLGTNCYLVDDGEGGVVVVDPGADAAEIRRAADGRLVSLVLVTHGHFDHVGALDELNTCSKGGWAMGALDAEGLDSSLAASARDFGLRVEVLSKPARVLHDGDELTVGALRFEVVACPGHTPGGVTYYDRAHGLAFTGDTLFSGSAGRTDLLGGDQRALFASLACLAELPPQTAVLPGHGPVSTIGRELRSNPYMRHAAGMS